MSSVSNLVQLIIKVTVGIVFALVCLALFVGVSGDPARNTNNRPSPALAKNRELTNAKQGAYELVLKNLKAPGTARLVESRIHDSAPPLYLIYICVDAQNSFGALIRNHFVVCLELHGEQYRYSPIAVVTEIGCDPVNAGRSGKEQIETMKVLNKWPGATLNR